VGEPGLDPAVLVQVRAAAHAFAAGLDGIALMPPELRAPVAAWQQQLRSAGEVLDLEAWLLGLLTLTCLSQRVSLPRPVPAALPGACVEP
jgi:hypothetical protein